MSFLETIDLNSVKDFQSVINNCEGLAQMLGRKLPVTTLFLIPFATNNDDVIFATTILGQREYIRNQRGNRSFKNKEIMDFCTVNETILHVDFKKIATNLSSAEMVAYALDIRTHQVVEVLKLHKNGVPYFTVNNNFVEKAF